MKRFRIAAVLLPLSLPPALLAQDAPKPAEEAAQAAATEATPAKENSPAAANESVKPDENASKPAAKPAPADADKKPAEGARSTPQRFIPSEQVRSDFDVSFPVDI